jgi:hypothetical protein
MHEKSGYAPRGDCIKKAASLSMPLITKKETMESINRLRDPKNEEIPAR